MTGQLQASSFKLQARSSHALAEAFAFPCSLKLAAWSSRP